MQIQYPTINYDNERRSSKFSSDMVNNKANVRVNTAETMYNSLDQGNQSAVSYANQAVKTIPLGNSSLSTPKNNFLYPSFDHMSNLKPVNVYNTDSISMTNSVLSPRTAPTVQYGIKGEFPQLQAHVSYPINASRKKGSQELYQVGVNFKSPEINTIEPRSYLDAQRLSNVSIGKSDMLTEMLHTVEQYFTMYMSEIESLKSRRALLISNRAPVQILQRIDNDIKSLQSQVNHLDYQSRRLRKCIILLEQDRFDQAEKDKNAVYASNDVYNIHEGAEPNRDASCGLLREVARTAQTCQLELFSDCAPEVYHEKNKQKIRKTGSAIDEWISSIIQSFGYGLESSLPAPLTMNESEYNGYEPTAHRRPDRPTAATGNSLIDTTNTVLDKILVPRTNIHHDDNYNVPPTNTTGNAFVDSLNLFLDNIAYTNASYQYEHVEPNVKPIPPLVDPFGCFTVTDITDEGMRRQPTVPFLGSGGADDFPPPSMNQQFPMHVDENKYGQKERRVLIPSQTTPSMLQAGDSIYDVSSSYVNNKHAMKVSRTAPAMTNVNSLITNQSGMVSSTSVGAGQSGVMSSTSLGAGQSGIVSGTSLGKSQSGIPNSASMQTSKTGTSSGTSIGTDQSHALSGASMHNSKSELMSSALQQPESQNSAANNYFRKGSVGSGVSQLSVSTIKMQNEQNKKKAKDFQSQSKVVLSKEFETANKQESEESSDASEESSDASEDSESS